MSLARAAVAAAGLALATLALPSREAEPPKQGIYSTLRVGLVFDVGGRGDKEQSAGACADGGGARVAKGAEVPELLA